MIFEDGCQSRDFIHVSDIVRANVLVMSSAQADYQVFNVGTGQPTTILDIAQTLIRLYGSTVAVDITRKYRAGDIRHCVADIAAIRRIGFSPSVALDQGLRDLVGWGKTEAAEDRVDAAAKELQTFGLTQG